MDKPFRATFFSLCFILIVFVFNSSGVTTRKMLKYRVDVNELPSVNSDNENSYVIVGVLTQEVSNFMSKKFPNETLKSYIAASYVKFAEGAGARVVPIWIGKDREYYEDILSKINGVLLPGGATFFNNSRGYAEAGQHIYDIAMEINDNGTYFPIWGTCLGFELLVYLSANGSEPRTDCSSSAQALPLEFKDDFRKSRMFGKASDIIIKVLKNYPVTVNFHMYCYTQKTFADMGLDQIWNVMSLNHDWNGEEFISSIEHKKYPFYGVQFHPEKNLYEHLPHRNITNTSRSILTSQYFADFFIREARRNHQRFANITEEKNSLIYNYAPRYTGVLGSAFEQTYLFHGEQLKRTNAGCINESWNLISVSINLWLGFMAIQRFWY